jgi:genome maintenance exonuclease 1
MRKMFKHNLVQEIDITTENIDGSRYYVLPSGDKFRSVTSVLSDALDKTALLEWKKRVGEEEAQKISTQAARRGTSVHTLCENYVLNKENYLGNSLPSSVDSFISIKSVLDHNVDNILGVETPLYSRALKTAGRCDLIAEYNGIASVIDFKTSRKLKKEEWIESYFLQTTVYSMMFEQIYKIKIPQVVVIISVDHEGPQVFQKDRNQYVNRVLDIFTTGSL